MSEETKNNIVDDTVDMLSDTALLTNIKYTKKAGNSLSCKPSPRLPFTPLPHQNRSLSLFNKNIDRGLILKHGLGTGKSCTSIMIIDDYLSKNKEAVVYIMTPGSLRENFMKEYCSFCGKNSIRLENRIFFISYNFSGIAKKLQGVSEKRQCLFVVDEFHNIMNGKLYNSTQKSAVYDLMYKNMVYNPLSRCILMSGTPFYNSILEIGPILKLVKRKSDEYEFPISKYESMMEEKDDSKWMKIIKELEKDNNTILPSILKGIVSSVDVSFGENRPELMELQEEYVYLSDYQEYYYNIIRDNEKRISNMLQKLTRVEAMLDPERAKLVDTLLYIYKNMLKSRPVLNFCYTEKIMDAIIDDMKNKSKSTEKEQEDDLDDKKDLDLSKLNPTQENIDDLDDSSGLIDSGNQRINNILANPNVDVSTKESELYLKDVRGSDYPVSWATGDEFKEIVDNLSKYSPKIDMIVKKIQEFPNNKHMIYSQFISRSGINIICSILEKLDISFIRYTGDIRGDSHRRSILNTFNDNDNMYGQKRRVILVSKAGTEGISLKHVNFVHILGPEVNTNILNQAIGRVVRNNSHAGMTGPLAGKVFPILYICRMETDETSDQIILKRSRYRFMVTSKISELLDLNSAEKTYSDITSKQTVNFFYRKLTGNCSNDLSCASGCCKNGKCVTTKECDKRQKKKRVLSTNFGHTPQQYRSDLEFYVRGFNTNLTKEQVDLVVGRLIEKTEGAVDGRKQIFDKIKARKPELSDTQINSLVDKYLKKKV